MAYKIKASAVGNLTDARYFAAREVRWMGFCLDPLSPHYIQPAIARAVMEWVEGPLFVGEFGLQPSDDIRQTAESLGLKAIQLHRETPMPVLEALRTFFVILEVEAADVAALPSLRAYCDRMRALAEIFLLRMPDPDVFEAQPAWKPAWRDFFRDVPCLVEATGDVDRLIALTEDLRPYGFSLRGGDEEKIGFKSYDELDWLLDALEGQPIDEKP